MSGMNEKCRCGQPADFRCVSRKVGPPIRDVTGIVKKQPYLDYFLCAACTKAEIQGSDAPREAHPLPHHAALLRRLERERVREIVGDVEQVRLGDWGRQGQHYPDDAA